MASRSLPDAPFGVTRSLSDQAWRQRVAPMADVLGIAQRFGVPEMVARVLAGRGVDCEAAQAVLAPTLKTWLPDPSTFLDLDASAARIADAVQAGQSIVVFGDYDVDGATAAAVLIRFLRAAGAPALSAYIPDRLMEGYGPSAEALLSLRAAGADLVITVDCGTQAFGALQAAADVGLPVIVVDHHKASPELPASLGLINPNRLDESAAASAFGHVCAAGMAFILAVGINRTLRTRGWYGAGSSEPKLTQLLDLVALGTVCDVVPLHGLNRAFVAQGLAVMAKRGNIGLAALADVAGLDRAPTAGALGFHLGPRINAGGRVGQSDLGVRLLTTDDAVLARDLAVQLDALNAERRAIEALVLDQALAAAERSDDPVITVAGEGWHPGVIGIVAGRIKERLGRPALVIGLDGTIGKGSGRSITGVDLGGAVIAAKDQGLLMAGGGHAMAAGLTVAAERVSELAGFLSHRLARDVAAARLDQALDLDGVLNARGVTPELVAAIEQAGPFGAGWPGPRFAIGPVTVAKSDRVGENHVRLILSGADGGRVKAVAFRAADTVLGQELLQPRGRRFAIAGRLVRDDWGEQDRAEVHIDDAAVLG